MKKKQTKVKAHLRKQGKKKVIVRTHARRTNTRKRQKMNKILAEDVTLGGVFNELVDSLKGDYKAIEKKIKSRGATYNDFFPTTATPGALEALDQSFYFTRPVNIRGSGEEEEEQ